MRILLDCGTYEYSNLGDVAMLQVAVTRLGAAWPGASVHVLTDRPDLLARHCPHALPVPATGRRALLGDHVLLGAARHRLPERAVHAALAAERALRRGAPALLETVLRGKLAARGETGRELAQFAHALATADLAVVSGAGGMTDHSHAWDHLVLETLDVALRRGVPAVMLGQGFGPLTDPRLRARAAAVLPRLTMIAAREGRTAPALLSALGVSASRVVVTGDDAIEPAYEHRPPALGTALGVNLRVAGSARVDESDVTRLAPAFADLAHMLGAPTVQLPIAVPRDVAAIGALLAAAGVRADTDGPPTSPRDVMRRAGRCRVVVTGAYHAAVFALAQGVPAVCLAQSDYFATKLRGLETQFGDGCTVVPLDRPGAPRAIVDAVLHAWRNADALRPGLLAAAARQAAAGRAAYASLPALVRRRGANRAPAPREVTHA